MSRALVLVVRPALGDAAGRRRRAVPPVHRDVVDIGRLVVVLSGLSTVRGELDSCPES